MHVKLAKLANGFVTPKQEIDWKDMLYVIIHMNELTIKWKIGSSSLWLEHVLRQISNSWSLKNMSAIKVCTKLYRWMEYQTLSYSIASIQWYEHKKFHDPWFLSDFGTHYQLHNGLRSIELGVISLAAANGTRTYSTKFLEISYEY